MINNRWKSSNSGRDIENNKGPVLSQLCIKLISSNAVVPFSLGYSDRLFNYYPLSQSCVIFSKLYANG